MSFPNEFEIPNANDFCRDNFAEGEKRCSMGWYRVLEQEPCRQDWDDPQFEFINGYCNKAKGLGLRGHGSVVAINDNRENNLADIRRCFIAGIEAMGYEVDES